MKKKLKKLVLAKETLRELDQLTPLNLQLVAGQVTGLYCTIDTTCCSHYRTCFC